MVSREADAIDGILEAWARERPDLDVSALAVIGRLSRYAALVQVRLDRVFAEHGLQSWEFDVLSALRRSGAPYELTPGELDRALLITSGTTTHRIQRLEARGFVTRHRDEADRRIVRVRLTETGRAAHEATHDAHAANETRILAGLSGADRADLLSGLQALGRVLGDTADDAVHALSEGETPA
ncbi:MarR family winged helix-turn-helix transcriptional regulator [Demequina soli]|uniref:MarR family winged helix-turn-helix transcriptional regulator n=1 Tax=Demequina soli TaxID=1638987 RepID=UPI000780FCB1|nr:MarR family transcriptional regulator [Demequina soli]